MVLSKMDIKQIRLHNLELALAFIERKDLAEKLEYQTNYLNQFLAQKNPKPVGDSLARKFEDKFNLLHGWFDTKRSVYDFSILFNKAANATKVVAISDKYDESDFADQSKNNIVPIEGTIEAMNSKSETVELKKTGLKKGIYAPNTKSNTVAFVVSGGELPRPYKNGHIVVANENEQPRPGEDVIIKFNKDKFYVCEFLYQSDNAFELENLLNGKRMTLQIDQIDKIYHVIGNFPPSQMVDLNS